MKIQILANPIAAEAIKGDHIDIEDCIWHEQVGWSCKEILWKKRTHKICPAHPEETDWKGWSSNHSKEQTRFSLQHPARAVIAFIFELPRGSFVKNGNEYH
jgi:hypothetical protein